MVSPPSENATVATALEDGDMICVLRDATGQKIAEGQRGRLPEQLVREQSAEAITRLAGGIAHDFNNLLAAIQGYGALLVEDLPAGSSERSFATQIVDATERAKALVNQLLALSRPQAKDQDMPTKTRVLVVDDEPPIAELVARMLIRAGYDADWCCNPLDALETFKEEPGGWQAVVSDQSMPDLGGDEFASRLKAINPAVAVILCTGHQADGRPLNPVISAVLHKPVSREQLKQAIEAALGGDAGAGRRGAA